MTNEDFKDICPYDDGDQFRQRMEHLLTLPGFERAMRYVLPDVDYAQLQEQLKAINGKDEFQQKVMLQILMLLELKTTSGVSDHGLDNLRPGQGCLFITNHRDIVLDAGFLGLSMLRHHLPAMEVALGDNLLIYDWIEDLVRLNKGIIVRRNLRLTKALEAAKQLSAYIHHAVTQKHQAVWIAQREGRAKDSNDVTQESVIKMLALGGQGDTPAQKLADLVITPTTLSYEYDPNDFLKAREFLARRRDPDFKKSPHDDLLAMETGILSFKGHVNITVGQPLTEELQALAPLADKIEAFHKICALIDREIHRGYVIYPVNYIAYDHLECSTRFVSHYTAKEVDHFDCYLETQIDKVDLPDITGEERKYMRDVILHMYSNPLRNKLKALGQEP